MREEKSLNLLPVDVGIPLQDFRLLLAQAGRIRKSTSGLRPWGFGDWVLGVWGAYGLVFWDFGDGV